MFVIGNAGIVRLTIEIAIGAPVGITEDVGIYLVVQRLRGCDASGVYPE